VTIVVHSKIDVCVFIFLLVCIMQRALH